MMVNGKVKRKIVLVTDAGRGSALAIIRSLGRQGWAVIAADSDPRSLGFQSRYTKESFVYPSPRTAPDDFIVALLQVVQEKKVGLFIPVTDEVIHPIAQARTLFEAMCQLALPDPQALDIVVNKNKTIQLAQQVGVPVPQTCVAYTVAEAREAARCLQWPIVLKPQMSRQYLPEQGVIESRSVSYANNLEELTIQMESFAGRCAVLLQEYCLGVGQGVEILAYCGRPLAAFQHKRLAEIPLTGGASAWRESVPVDQRLYGYASRLVAALHWTGLIMVEFKVGESVKLMEINGRVWGSLPLAVLSGMDFPGRLADLYLKGPPPPGIPPVTSYQVGVRAYNVELMLNWLVQVLWGKQRYPFLPQPRRYQIASPLLNLFNPWQRYDILSWEDPRPGLAELVKISRKVRHKFQLSVNSKQ